MRTADEAYMDGGYTIVVPFGSDSAKSFFDNKFDLGDRIYISGGYGYWPDLAIGKSFKPVDDGYAIKLESLRRPIRPFRSDTPAVIMAANVGYFAIVNGEMADGGYFNASMLSDEGSIVVLTGQLGSVVTRMFPDGTFDRPIDDDTYTMEVISKTGDRARILLGVDRGDGMTTTTWSRSRGNLFTRPYMMLTDEIGNVRIGEVVFNPGTLWSLFLPNIEPNICYISFPEYSVYFPFLMYRV